MITGAVRPGLYGVRIRQQALQIIYRQVTGGHTSILVKEVIKWPDVEIQIFLEEMMACLPEIW